MRATLAVLLLAASPLAGCFEPPAPPGGGGASEGPGGGATNGTGPAWSFVDTDGATHSRDTPAGNATVLFFMASWCTTCRSKTPMLARVEADSAPHGVRFYSVSFDPTDDPASLRAWKAKYSQRWPHGVDPGFAIQRTFGITSQSSLVVLDGSGNLVQKWGYGGVDESSLRAAIDRARAA